MRKIYPDSSTVLYTYDPAGRFTQAQDASGTYGFSYDNMDRLTEADTTYAFLSGLRAVKYGYDYASSCNSMIDPGSEWRKMAERTLAEDSLSILSAHSCPALVSPSSRTMSESPSATAAKIERPSDDQETRRAMKVARPPKSVI